MAADADTPTAKGQDLIDKRMDDSGAAISRSNFRSLDIGKVSDTAVDLLSKEVYL
jgi:hypothetical protein